MERVESQTPERSIGELFGELASETGTLVRQEVKLATTELSQKATFAVRHAVYVIIGALLAVVALQVLSATLVLALARVVPAWAASLIVGGAIGVVAFVIIRGGLSAIATMNLKLPESAASLKEDKSWAKRQIQ